MRDSGRLHLPCLLAILLSLISPTAYSQPAGLQSFEAHYSISRQGITLGRLKLSLRFDSSGNYRYRANSEHTGLFSWLHPQQVEERSEGHFEQGQVIPQRYHYLRRHSDEKKQIELQFDWQKRQVTTSTGDSRWRQLIETGTQDKFSQQLAVRLDLAQGKSEMHYRVADGGRLKNYYFQLRGRERIKTVAGTLDCLRVERRKGSGKIDSTIWFAPTIDHLPVRILRSQGGAKYLMELEVLVSAP
ncbi:DUF3108 domain-containing protein [endosymbiont of Ridgeia piscesae]|jgi:hypothetical protein|uniref:DUF3108 domain-containing protein n=1 Tax=endosymbiont of Ridgeia piscesae TaxID=54398 RepID=A0A0T5YYZ8_9GAMM|nr:DUF3108 domain-containing protein [endosymbiont of Ridgeia piscesae]KRT55876.1 Protein of unknown function (DUF3108) [endosymbiont of Ridgeia piscesae]KRT59736.1 Protein of unknown function (DUF3108) [endosymbiont of Ridgeia piscesae]